MAAASGQSCRWIARDVPQRCLASRWTPTATSGVARWRAARPGHPDDDIWIYDFARAARSRLTTHPAPDSSPIWTPDGQRIIFTSLRAGYPELFWRPADGTGSDERLLARAKDLINLRANGWSADGRQLLFTEVSASNQSAIGQMAIERPSDVKDAA